MKDGYLYSEIYQIIPFCFFPRLFTSPSYLLNISRKFSFSYPHLHISHLSLKVFSSRLKYTVVFHNLNIKLVPYTVIEWYSTSIFSVFSFDYRYRTGWCGQHHFCSPFQVLKYPGTHFYTLVSISMGSNLRSRSEIQPHKPLYTSTHSTRKEKGKKCKKISRGKFN